jgi:glutamyl endopeptidase
VNEVDDEGGDNEGDVTDVDEGQERIVGIDERIQINPATSQPYRWICHLKISTINATYGGSGFLVNIPGSNAGCILTAGHNLWMDTRTYAERLEVTFPGKEPIIVSEPTNNTSRQRYFVSPQYKQRFDRYHDYGIIVLPGYQRKGFGYSVVVTDDEIRAATAVVFGYPGDKPHKTMWGTGSGFLDPEPMLLRYTLDTAGGQSGSPVYVWHKGYVSLDLLGPVVVLMLNFSVSGQRLGSTSSEASESILQFVSRLKRCGRCSVG